MAVDIVERLKRAQVTRATYKLHGVDFEGFASPVVGERDSNAELDFVVEVFKDCAAEIERLRAERDEYKDAFEFAHKEFHDALDDLAKMKAERDEARRRYCQSMLEHGEIWRRVEGRNVLCTTHDDVAEIMGWKLP